MAEDIQDILHNCFCSAANSSVCSQLKMQRIFVDVGILLQSPLRRFNVEQIIG